MIYKNKKRTKQSSISFGASIADEKGSILLITIVMLLLLTLIGISGINTASTDLKITSNYRVYKQNLMLADGAVNYAKSMVANNIAIAGVDAWVNNVSVLFAANPARYLNNSAAWVLLAPDTPVLNQINVLNVIADWEVGLPAITPQALPGQPNTQFVVYRNLMSTDGNSVVIVRSTQNNGLVIIETGFDTN